MRDEHRTFIHFDESRTCRGFAVSSRLYVPVRGTTTLSAPRQMYEEIPPPAHHESGPLRFQVRGGVVVVPYDFIIASRSSPPELWFCYIHPTLSLCVPTRWYHDPLRTTTHVSHDRSSRSHRHPTTNLMPSKSRKNTKIDPFCLSMVCRCKRWSMSKSRCAYVHVVLPKTASYGRYATEPLSIPYVGSLSADAVFDYGRDFWALGARLRRFVCCSVVRLG